MDYHLTQLGVSQIEIYQLDTIKRQLGFASDTTISRAFMKYLISYDSKNRLHAINYKFMIHSKFINAPDGETVLPIIVGDSSLYYNFVTPDSDTVLYNSWRKEYHFKGSLLDNMKIIKPLATVIDGVFIASEGIERSSIETIKEDGQIIEIKYFKYGKLIQTDKYTYNLIENNGVSQKLLTEITHFDEQFGGIDRTIINYSF